MLCGMLSWALTFFILAVIAAILGFTGIAVAVASIAKLFLILFIILFVASFFFRAAEKGDRVIDRSLS